MSLFLGLAVAGTPAYAQTGQVKGKIVDAKNQPVEKAQIIIEATDGMGRKFKVESNKKGEYIQIGLPPGQYQITATKDGLSDMHEQRIGLDPAEVNLTLRPGGAPRRRIAPKSARRPRRVIAAIRGNFDVGVKLSNENKHDEAIAKFNEVLDRGAEVRRVLHQHRVPAADEEGLRRGRGDLQAGARR